MRPAIGMHALQARRQRGVPLTGLATMVALAALMPLGFVLFVAWQTGWTQVAALVFRPRVGELLVNTALLEIVTVPATVGLAVALAWLTERSSLPAARLWAGLAVAPFAVPAFVQSYAWVSLAPTLHGLFAAAMVSTLAYFPFVYLPVAAQLRRLDPALEDAAASLGHRPGRIFLTVVVPQLRLAICGGSLLVALHLLAEYGLYVTTRFDTFTTAIVDQFQSAYNGPAANMLGGVLVLCCLALLATETFVRGDARYARVGAGSPRPVPRQRLGRWTAPAMALPALVALLSLGVPMVTLTRWIVAGGADIWHWNALGLAFLQTLGLALAGGIVTTLLAFPMAWLSIRSPGRLQRVLEACHYYVGSLPGVVLALALVTITVRVALPIYQTMATLLLAYALLFLPRALVALRASIAQAPIELERAAMALGRSPLRAVWQVTMRLAAPGFAASVALAAMGIANELTATLMLAPNGTETLSTAFWSYSSELDYAAAAPYAVLMIVLSLPLTYLLHIQSRRLAGR